MPALGRAQEGQWALPRDDSADGATTAVGRQLFSILNLTDCGFNRSMQRIHEIVELVSRSLVSSSGVRSTVEQSR